MLRTRLLIPEDGSTRFVNGKFEGDGQFVDLATKDETTKTEYGIHVEGAEQTFDRDLWEDGKS